MFYIVLDSVETRTRLIKHLGRRGIHAVFHYVPLHSSPAGLRYGRAASAMNVTNDLSERLLRLPLHYEMEDEDVAYVIIAIYEFFGCDAPASVRDLAKQ